MAYKLISGYQIIVTVTNTIVTKIFIMLLNSTTIPVLLVRCCHVRAMIPKAHQIMKKHNANDPFGFNRCLWKPRSSITCVDFDYEA